MLEAAVLSAGTCEPLLFPFTAYAFDKVKNLCYGGVTISGNGTLNLKRHPRVTIRDVARSAGVSVTTVSRVLNGDDVEHMRPETKARVLEAIEALDYVPVRMAQRLRRQKTQIIAVLLPDISNPFFSLLARGVGSVAFEEGYSTLICDSNHSAEKELRYLEILLAEQVEGIIFIPVGQPDKESLNRLLRRGIDIVVADRSVDGLPSVEADNKSGSYSLTTMLAQNGYRNIAYIAGPQEVSTASDRLSGFVAAMRNEGLEPAAVLYGNFTYESGYALAQDLLRSTGVDAIMAGNDLMAVGVIKAAEELGLHVPRDIGVTGFDHLPLLEFVQPRLTTIYIPAYEMGEKAMKVFIRRGKGISTKKKTVLRTKLIYGDSCRNSRPLQGP